MYTKYGKKEISSNICDSSKIQNIDLGRFKSLCK